MTKKEKMLSVARKLFWKKGFESTTMIDIAHAYGCKPGNIYNFFKDKEDILFQALLEEMEQIISPIKHLEDSPNGSPIDQLRTIITSHLQLTLSHRRSAKLLFDIGLDNLSASKRKEIIAMRDTYDRILRQVIRRGIQDGSFDGLDERIASIMISSMVVRTRMWFHNKKGMSIEQLAEFILQFSIRGLGGNLPNHLPGKPKVRQGGRKFVDP
jgi:AcrR family transcriptional regulator